MNKPAAIAGSYYNLRPIVGRKVCQVIIEIPIEKMAEFIEAFGSPCEEVWIAMARLNLKEVMPPAPTNQHTDTSPRSQEAAPQTGGARKPFNSLPLPQQAALLCNDPVFRAFLNEEFAYDCETENDAAEAVRELCEVTSRSELNHDAMAGKVFIRYREQFQAWKLVSA
jgi:hypothetical protein